MKRETSWGNYSTFVRRGLSGIMGDYLFLNKNPIKKKIIINTRSSIYKEEMRKQNHPIELFIVTNFILMKSTRLHYSGLGHNLCYKETSAVTKFALIRSTHWRIQGQGRGCVCRLGVGPGRAAWRAAGRKSPDFPSESKCLEIIHTPCPHHAHTHT